ncbi:hypothetical protein [Dactylosporangium siamense]|uniref:hypothetical protein n=1 Tax=Dactylosporangium siamense TaxID=685454 RepID=UPI0019423743|nr:hypothetical protein [Dactylosporangium siamense]
MLTFGEGPVYDWAPFIADIEARLRAAEVTGVGTGSRYVHTQPVPSASWTINHALSTKPGVTVISASGQQLLPEVHYPNDGTAVLVFGSPLAGMAYLHG